MSFLKNVISRLITAKMAPGSKASIVISADNGAAIVLPLVPADLPEISNPQNNETFEGILGTMSVIGTLGLRSVSIKGLLPVDPTKYPFANPLGSSAAEVINFVSRYRSEYIPVRLVIAFSDGSVYINMACLINDFSYSIDNAKDYHYKIDLIEYRMVQPVTGGLVS